MRISNLLLSGLFALAALSSAHADGTLQTVPVPDTSKLPADAAKQITAERAEFDKARAGLVGPPLAQLYAILGATYVRNGFDEAAAVAFYDATQINPNDGRWYYLRGVVARKLKHPEDARANFQAALDHDKAYLPIRVRLADTLIELKDYAAARKLLESSAREINNQPVIFAMLGELAMQEKRYADAVTNINAALKLDPKANELYRHLADAYAGQGNTKAADEARAKAGDVITGLDDPLVASMVMPKSEPLSGTPLEQAQTLARQGDLAGALDKLGTVIKANPADVDALTLAARINAASGDFAVAQGEIDQALKAKPDSAIAHLSNGVLAEYQSDEPRASAEYQRAQRLDAKLPDTWVLLGNTEMRHARYAQAADQYRQLTVQQPDNANAYAHLVAALVAQGKCSDALQDINGAIAKRPKDGYLLQIFVRLASTCPAASAKERDLALDYGQSLYKERPGPNNSSGLALAFAAHGKFKEAQEYQAEAIFESLRAGDKGAAALYKSTTQDFFAKQKVPDRPWPAEHDYFKAPMLIAQRPAPAAAPTPPKP